MTTYSTMSIATATGSEVQSKITNGTAGFPYLSGGSGAINTWGGTMVNTSQPAFNAYLNSDASNATGDGTAYTIVFNATRADQGSNFNTGSGTYTFPTSGFYILTAVISLSGIGASHTSLTIYFIAAGVTQIVHTINPALISVSGVYTYTASAVITATATNTAIVQVTVSGSTKTVNLQGNGSGSACNFSGCLLC